MAWWSWTEETT